jgi:hypothetical protein
MPRQRLVKGPRAEFVPKDAGLGCALLGDDAALTTVQGVDELWHTKITGLIDMLYASTSVVVLFVSYFMSYTGVATAISVLNTVVFGEEQQAIIEYTRRVRMDPSSQFGALLFKIQAHVAIPAVIDVIPTGWRTARLCLTICYFVCICFQQCATGRLQSLSNHYAVFNFLSSCIGEKGLTYTSSALLLLLVEKTGNFWMVIPRSASMWILPIPVAQREFSNNNPSTCF